MNPEDSHVGEQLSGYIDGELTQQQRQRVELHCESCAECREQLEGLMELREQVSGARLSVLGEDTWRENMTEVRTTRGIGWILLIGGLLAIGGIGIYQFIMDNSIELHMKIIVSAIYGGGALLFISVLRQRLIERKTDKYKDVEI